MRNIFLWFYKVTGWCSFDIGNLLKIHDWRIEPGFTTARGLGNEEEERDTRINKHLFTYNYLTRTTSDKKHH
jgi:hypothetical protein